MTVQIAPGSVPPDTLDAIVQEWARAKIQKLDILNHNGAMLAYTAKADSANRMGLSDRQKLGVTPFPSPSTISINQPAADTSEMQYKLEQRIQQLQDKLDNLSQLGDRDRAEDKDVPEKVNPTTGPENSTATKNTWPRRLAEWVAIATVATAATLGAGKLLGDRESTPKEQANVTVVMPADESGPAPVTPRGMVGVEVEGWLRQNQ